MQRRSPASSRWDGPPAAAHQAAYLVQQIPLCLAAHRHLPRASALGGGRLHRDAVAAVRMGRRELDRFLPAQPERRLQAQRHPNVRIPDPRQLGCVEVAAPGTVGDVGARADAVIGVGFHHVRLADPVCPPAHVCHAVSHRGRRQPPFGPMAHECLDVLALEPLGPQSAVAEFVQRVRHLRERVGAIPARGVPAVAGAPLQQEEVPVQVPHGRPMP